MLLNYDLNIPTKVEFKYFAYFLLLEIISAALAWLNPIFFLLPFLPVIGLFFFYSTFIKDPFFWIIIMLIGSGLESWGIVFGGITVFHIGWFLLILSTPLYLLFNPTNKITKFSPINIYVISFIVLALISLVYSPNKVAGLIQLSTTVALFIFFILYLNFVTSQKRISLVLITLALINILLSLLTFYQLLFENVLYIGRATVTSESGEKIWRASGTFEDPNVTAIFLMIGFIYAIAMLLNLKGNFSARLFYGIASIISGVGIIATFSRSAWIACFVGIIVTLALNRNKRILIYSFIGLVVFFLVFILFTPYGEFITFRIFSIFDVMEDPSIRTRLALINSGFAMFIDNPFLGIGFRGFPILYDLYLDPIVPWFLIHVKESHTLIITLLAELGVAGLIVVILWFRRVFIDSHKLIKTTTNNFYSAVLLVHLQTFSHLM
ncbi:MAG: O-antigen ligase family protein [Melioribacteraceae bacterium]|nr:O-antigen ligase family protein [Melioribacteraceae bacterium]